MQAKKLKSTLTWDFMKPDAIQVSSEATIGEAVRVMEKFQIHHLLVMDNDGKEFKGLIEARDIAFVGSDNLFGEKVTRVMRTSVPVILEATDVGGALSLMEKHRLTALPIVDKGRIVGILTETDLLKLLAALLGKQPNLPMLLKGEAALANPLLQNIFRLLSAVGL